MTFKFSTFCTWTFCFVFFSFLAVHHAHMKSSVPHRGVASWEQSHPVKPWYDASYKY